MTDVVDLAAKLGRIAEPWSPRIVGELNGQQVKLARLEGEFVWHHHAGEDELFLVLEGRLDLHLREADGERVVSLGPGQFAIVPRGVEHKPVARPTAGVLLFEPAATLNTGNLRNDLTVDAPERL